MNWEGGSCNWSKGRPDRYLPTNGLDQNGWPGLATGPRLGQTAIYRLMDWPKMVGQVLQLAQGSARPPSLPRPETKPLDNLRDNLLDKHRGGPANKKASSIRTER